MIPIIFFYYLWYKWHNTWLFLYIENYSVYTYLSIILFYIHIIMYFFIIFINITIDYMAGCFFLSIFVFYSHLNYLM